MEILEKHLIIERQFSQNVTIFTLGLAYFFVSFLPKKRTNVNFQTVFKGKSFAIERQFSQIVTVFMLGSTYLLVVFLGKKI